MLLRYLVFVLLWFPWCIRVEPRMRKFIPSFRNPLRFAKISTVNPFSELSPGCRKRQQSREWFLELSPFCRKQCNAVASCKNYPFVYFFPQISGHYVMVHKSFTCFFFRVEFWACLSASNLGRNQILQCLALEEQIHHPVKEIQTWHAWVFVKTPSSRWWFQTFFIFTLTWGNDLIWVIFFKWVETTN